MQMGRPPRMAPQLLQHATDGSIVRDGIRRGKNRLEVIPAVRPADQLTARLRPREFRTLDVVEAFLVGLPDGNLGARDRFPSDAADSSADVAGLALGAVR